MRSRFIAAFSGLIAAFAVTCAPQSQMLMVARQGSTAAATIDVNVVIEVWDDGSAGTTNVVVVQNLASASYISTVELALTGGGVWDVMAFGNTFTLQEPGMDANNDGMTSVAITLDFGTPGLAPNATDTNLPGAACDPTCTGDWDGTVTGIDAVVTFSSGCTLEGALTQGAASQPMNPTGSSWTFAPARASDTGCGALPPPGEGDELVAGTTNYFVNPLDASCSNSNNGLYPEEVSGADGPWCDNVAVEAATFTDATDSVWIVDGSALTGVDARLQNTTITGTQSGGACTRHFVVGAFYMDGATARRGLNGGARPILQGSVGFWDHTIMWTGGGTSADWYPGDRYQAMIGEDDGRMSCVRFENLHLRNVGGRGITLTGVVGPQFYNLYIEGTYDTGIHTADAVDALFDSNYIKGDNFVKPLGDSPFWGAAITCVAPCTNIVVRGNYVWDGWGEGINSFTFGTHETQGSIIEDNFVMDHQSTLIYSDGMREAIIRRNVLARTGRTIYWRNVGGGYRGDAVVHSDEAMVSYINDGSAYPTQDVVVYANIIAGVSECVNIWQWGDATGAANYSFNARTYWYGNLCIDSEETIGEWATDVTNGRFWSNASVLFTMGHRHIKSGQTPQSATVDANYWSSTPEEASWIDAQDVVGGCTLTKTSGWRDLEDLVTLESDGSLSVAEMLDLKAQIIAGARPASAAACEGTGVAIASRGFPAGVTVEAGPADADFDDVDYSTADIGAFAL